MTTGELIRALSVYCPDTSIGLLTPDGPFSIGACIDADDEPEASGAECWLTVLESE